MKIVPNENIIKLRKLTEELSETHDDNYKAIVWKLKAVIDSGKEEIENSKTSQSKIKCYESMCKTITTLLTNVKFI